MPCPAMPPASISAISHISFLSFTSRLSAAFGVALGARRARRGWSRFLGCFAEGLWQMANRRKSIALRSVHEGRYRLSPLQAAALPLGPQLRRLPCNHMGPRHLLHMQNSRTSCQASPHVRTVLPPRFGFISRNSLAAPRSRAYRVAETQFCD